MTTATRAPREIVCRRLADRIWSPERLAREAAS
jgi:hypothetical protein